MVEGPEDTLSEGLKHRLEGLQKPSIEERPWVSGEPGQELGGGGVCSGTSHNISESLKFPRDEVLLLSQVLLPSFSAGMTSSMSNLAHLILSRSLDW